MLIHPKKSLIPVLLDLPAGAVAQRGEELSAPPTHTHPRSDSPRWEKKIIKKKRSLLFREGGRSENWNGGKIHHHPTPQKISCPKRSEVGAPPPYRSIRLNFRKCPLISIYFNENFGSSWSWWFMIKSIKLRPLRACGFFSDFIRQQIKRLVKNFKFSWRQVKIILKLRKFNAKQFSAQKKNQQNPDACVSELLLSANIPVSLGKY